MYEHAIPQNIMEYEFKLFAGLTLKQFIYVAVSGGFAFALFQLNRVGVFPTFFAWMIIPAIIIIGLSLGLGSFQRRSLEEWLSSYTRASNMPLRRVWKKDNKAVKSDQFDTTKPEYLPGYLSAYLLTKDEFIQIMKQQTMGGTFNSIIDIPETVPTINLTPGNAYEYAEVGTEVPPIPNTIVFRIQEDEIPMEGVVANVRDMQGQIVSSLRSNADGILYFNQPFATGEYDIDFQLPDISVLPKIHLVFDGSTYPLINLTPLA
jgi:hypothetical protein